MTGPHDSNDKGYSVRTLFDWGRLSHWELSTALVLLPTAVLGHLGQQAGIISTPAQRLALFAAAFCFAPIVFNLIGYSSEYDRPKVRFRWLGKLHPWLATQRGTETACAGLGCMMALIAIFIL